MLWIVLGTIGIVAAAIGVGVLVDRKWALLPKPQELLEAGKPPGPEPGEAPATALAAPPKRVRCSACKGSTLLDGESPIRFGDRELVALRYRCTKCASVTTVYVSR